MIINKTNHKRKERRVSQYPVNHGWKGQDPNNKRTWIIRIIETKEILEYYRTQNAAQFNLSSWEKKVYDKCEVVRN